VGWGEAWNRAVGFSRPLGGGSRRGGRQMPLARGFSAVRLPTTSPAQRAQGIALRTRPDPIRTNNVPRPRRTHPGGAPASLGLARPLSVPPPGPIVRFRAHPSGPVAHRSRSPGGGGPVGHGRPGGGLEARLRSPPASPTRRLPKWPGSLLLAAEAAFGPVRSRARGGAPQDRPGTRPRPPSHARWARGIVAPQPAMPDRCRTSAAGGQCSPKQRAARQPGGKAERRRANLRCWRVPAAQIGSARKDPAPPTLHLRPCSPAERTRHKRTSEAPKCRAPPGRPRTPRRGA
jgi:hypothetical protein